MDRGNTLLVLTIMLFDGVLERFSDQIQKPHIGRVIIIQAHLENRLANIQEEERQLDDNWMHSFRR